MTPTVYSQWTGLIWGWGRPANFLQPLPSPGPNPDRPPAPQSGQGQPANYLKPLPPAVPTPDGPPPLWLDHSLSPHPAPPRTPTHTNQDWGWLAKFPWPFFWPLDPWSDAPPQSGVGPTSQSPAASPPSWPSCTPLLHRFLHWAFSLYIMY